MRPSRTKLYSSSRVCRCSGAASARGDIGCSTSEKRSPRLAPVDQEADADAPEEAVPAVARPTIRGPLVVVSIVVLLFTGH